jgi:hypothetical protein
MGLLDWIKDERNARQPASKSDDISRRCTPSYEKQLAECKQDREMPKERNEKAPPKRVNLRSHDIPF